MLSLTNLVSIQASVESKLIYKKPPLGEEPIRSTFTGRYVEDSVEVRSSTVSATALLKEFQESTNKKNLIPNIKSVNEDLYRQVAETATSNEVQAIQDAIKGLIALAAVETASPEQTTSSPEASTGEGETVDALQETSETITPEQVTEAKEAIAAEEVDAETSVAEPEETSASKKTEPQGEQIRSGISESVSYKLVPGQLSAATIVDQIFGNLKMEAAYSGLSRIASNHENSSLFEFYFDQGVEAREFIEPLSSWLYMHQHPQFGFVKVDKANNALIYKYREADTDIAFSKDGNGVTPITEDELSTVESSIRIDSNLSVVATQPSGIAATTASQLTPSTVMEDSIEEAESTKKINKKKQKIRSGLDERTVKALFNRYNAAELIRDEIGDAIEGIKVIKPRVSGGSIDVPYRVGDISSVVVLYPEEVKYEEDLIPRLASMIIADYRNGEVS